MTPLSGLPPPHGERHPSVEQGATPATRQAWLHDLERAWLQQWTSSPTTDAARSAGMQPAAHADSRLPSREADISGLARAGSVTAVQHDVRSTDATPGPTPSKELHAGTNQSSRTAGHGASVTESQGKAATSPPAAPGGAPARASDPSAAKTWADRSYGGIERPQASVAPLPPFTGLLIASGPVPPPLTEARAAPAGAKHTHRHTASVDVQEAPSPTRLLLQEQSPGVVLAALRDSALNSVGSAQAAQALANALLQAGYARVQVFVNGNRHTAHTDQAPPNVDEPSHRGTNPSWPLTSSPHPLQSKEFPHGH